MSTDAFGLWATFHAQQFGLTDPETEVVLGWRKTFAGAKYTPNELEQVTEWMIGHPESLNNDCKFQGKLIAHLRAIQLRIRDIRNAPPAAPPRRYTGAELQGAELEGRLSLRELTKKACQLFGTARGRLYDQGINPETLRF